jgi:putative alpha-1,2-mannosidase
MIFIKKSIIVCGFLLQAIIAFGQSNIEYVDSFVGTSGDHGQFDPSATIPFGQIKVGPDTEPANHGGYDYESTVLKGFSINRISGVGCSGAGGNLRIKPITQNAAQIVNINKKKEVAYPGYYATNLDNDVFVEMTASRAVALQNFIFPRNANRILSLDLHSSFERFYNASYKKVSENEISGLVSAANVCNKGKYTIYFHLKTTEPFTITEAGKGVLNFTFKKESKQAIELRIAVSSIDIETAKMENQLLTQSFKQVRKLAFKQWQAKMNKIDLSGNEVDKKLFYSMLYKVYLSPVNIASYDGRYRGSDGKIYSHKNPKYYSSWSIWDTYRTKFPLLNLLEPDEMTEISNSLLELYKQGKVNWSTINEPTPTVRTEHSLIVVLDAIEKGVQNIDILPSYDAMKQEASNLAVNTPDNKLESAYDLWALSKIAQKKGFSEDSAIYAQKSEEMWVNVWNTKFRTINPETFDIMYSDGLYQGTLWQYRWAVPFDVDKMSNLVGGKEELRKELTYFFENNLYNQGNQPDIQAPFIFNRLNDNVSTNKWVRAIIKGNMKHYYGSKKKNIVPYIGPSFNPTLKSFIPEMDDDDGTMSAWYVFASTGLFPLLPGSSNYELLVPIFDKVIFKLSNKKKFTIINQSKNVNVEKNYTFNKVNLENFQINHHLMLNGGNLTITDK